MPNLNKVMLIGNLTRDPEIKYTPKGTAVSQIGLAVNRVYSNDAGEKVEETTFVDVELWGRQAEIAGEYLKKGRPVFIEGRLKLDSWDDKQTGQKRSKLKVVGEGLQLLGSREGGGGGRASDAGGGGEEASTMKPPGGEFKKPAPPPKRPPADPDLDAEPDDIPF
ncbi:MAG: single-stranded DNA-binding protein [Verrucomicrobiota bacterium]|nr:single-stranded DNA-binding protein [Verrucomicrobiota bacterium]